MAPRRHHRFPRGETCSECPARRWYLENGRRYCENGHQVEGYVQFDIDEDDNFGKSGRVARKKKEARQAERKHLAGNEARELYLECLQLLLRKQVLWLVRKKGFHPELEAVCRDLWLLRVREFPGLARTRGGRDGKGKGAAGAGAEGLVMFSSQAQAVDGEEKGGEEELGWTRKGRSWNGEIWPVPGVVDTLALVYLGCVLRQEPVRIGDVYRWARNGQIPFLAAVSTDKREKCCAFANCWADRLCA